eukprot:sb/3467454/
MKGDHDGVHCAAHSSVAVRDSVSCQKTRIPGGLYTTKGHFIGASDHSTKGHFVSTASRQPDGEDHDPTADITPENQITTMKEEPTTPNVLTTEVNMTAFTDVEGTQVLPEITVNPAVTSTKPDVFTTRGNGTSPITEGWSSPLYNASEYILVTLPRDTQSPPSGNEEGDGDDDDDDDDDDGDDGEIRGPEYKYPDEKHRGGNDEEDDEEEEDNNVVGEFKLSKLSPLWRHLFCSLMRIKSVKVTLYLTTFFLLPVITEQPSETPCQSAIECLNFGRPVCQNGLFEYCLCRTEFKGMI